MQSIYFVSWNKMKMNTNFEKSEIVAYSFLKMAQADYNTWKLKKSRNHYYCLYSI